MDIHNPVGDGVLDIPCERTARYFADNRNNGKNYEGTPRLMKGMIKMAKMNVRKMKMRCDVKGCRNVDSYCISRSAEMGGVVICEDCLRDALTAIENYVEPKKKTDTKPPELFYSGIENIVSEVSDNDDELSLAGEAAENDTSQKDVPNTEDIQNTKTEDVPNLSKKPTNSKSATPKRAAKKKTAERGNDK